MRGVSVPSAGQLAWQRAGFGMFCHFGVNTFHDLEWSDGTLPAESFDPSALDAGQWADAAVEAGMRYLVLTAKHHDGFCLWPTDTTAYSVRSSPWRRGRGDVVEEVAEACRARDLGFGLYLSPWDRNAACYADPPAYDAFYARQLTELCTRYGELFELWFDGAGSEGRSYDWERVMAIVDEHQPGAMVFNMGRPTIRWIGNEDGLADDPVRYVVDETLGNTGGASSEWLAGYLPPECDVPIRGNWFWRTDDLASLKSLDQLLEIHARSVGLGAGLLLNVPPDRRGLLDARDVERLQALASEVERLFSRRTPARLVRGTDPGIVQAVFDRPTRLERVVLEEELSTGQGISGFELAACGRTLARGASVGIRRFCEVGELETDRIDIRLTGSGTLAALSAYASGGTGGQRA